MPVVGGSVHSLVLFTSVLFRGPRGAVFTHVRRITLSFSRNAKAAAPVRTGNLRRSIRAGTPRNPTAHTVRGTVSVGAPYAMFVLRGTANKGTGRIYSTRGYTVRGNPKLAYSGGGVTGPPTPRPGMMMAVGRNLYPPVTPRFSVQGQRPNNFLEAAWVRTGATHRSIRGLPFPVSF